MTPHRRRLVRRVGGLSLALLLAAQLVPVERDGSPAGAEIPAPPAIRGRLESSCYDCHSNCTRWPWYAHVAPVSWWIARHVRKGRSDLDLTAWPLLDAETQRFHLLEMKEQVKGREMPLASYLLLTPGARMSDEERLELVLWIDGELASLAAF